MISCGRSGWLAQNLAMLLDIPPYRRSHFERRLAECSILCLPFSLSSRCFVMRCQTERPWIAWTGTPTASPKCYANDQARDALKMGRDWPVMPPIRPFLRGYYCGILFFGRRGRHHGWHWASSTIEKVNVGENHCRKKDQSAFPHRRGSIDAADQARESDPDHEIRKNPLVTAPANLLQRLTFDKAN